MFRRRHHDEEPEKRDGENSVEPTDEVTGAVEPTDEVSGAAERDDEEAVVVTATTAGADGPWDSAGTVPAMDRIDFGALQVPIGDDIEIQVNVEATEEDDDGDPAGGRVVAITIVYGESGLQVQPFAAPKKDGLWEEIREETAEEIKEAEGETQEADGPFGTELHGMVPVAIPDEMRDQVPTEIAEQGYGWQPVRFFGVDGPRWFLRGVLSGAALEDEEQARVMEHVFGNIVVVRGDEPMPPRDLLELTLPAEAQQAIAEQQGDDDGDHPTFDPFERGPEITEVR